MGSTLLVNDTAAWMPTAGVYLRALELISQKLDEGHPIKIMIEDELRAEVLIFDFSEFNDDEMQLIYTIFNSIMETATDQGPSFFRNPPLYASVKSIFLELRATLEVDKRVHFNGGIKQLHVNETQTWSAPEWVYRLIVGVFEGSLRIEFPEIAKIFTDKVDIDLSQLNSLDFQKVWVASEWVNSLYGVNPGYVTVCDDFNKYLLPLVSSLISMLKGDARMAAQK